MCTTKTMIGRVKKLQAIEEQIAELQAAADKLKDSIKADMGESEELEAGQFKIRYKTIFGSRLDSRALKAELPEIFKQYSRTTMARRFSIA